MDAGGRAVDEGDQELQLITTLIGQLRRTQRARGLVRGARAAPSLCG